MRPNRFYAEHIAILIYYHKFCDRPLFYLEFLSTILWNLQEISISIIMLFYSLSVAISYNMATIHLTCRFPDPRHTLTQQKHTQSPSSPYI